MTDLILKSSLGMSKYFQKRKTLKLIKTSRKHDLFSSYLETNSFRAILV